MIETTILMVDDSVDAILAETVIVNDQKCILQSAAAAAKNANSPSDLVETDQSTVVTVLPKPMAQNHEEILTATTDETTVVEADLLLESLITTPVANL